MARLRRKRRRPGEGGMSPFIAGLITLLLIAVGSYFGFTKTNPFASPYSLEAVFENASSIKPGSPVRIAGVDVGKVKKVETIDSKTGAAKLTMELQEAGLPIHTDAELKIRPRILLEGNFFVDVSPGTPTAPIRESDDDPIPMDQTAQPVQLGEILNLLKADVRGDLRTLLAEYSLKGLGGGGAEAFNDAIPFFEGAYRNSSQVNDALLGTQPTQDVQRLLEGQQKTAAALTVDEGSLKDLVTNINTTATALASEDEALQASLPALRDTLVAGEPALASLNGALPPLRAFAVDALPGVLSSAETIDAALPFIRQTRLLLRPEELQGTAAELRRQIPSLVRLNGRLIPFLSSQRELASCTNEVLVPFAESEIPSGEEGNSGQTVREQINRSFVGLAGDSRTNDANSPFFRVQAVPPTNLALGEVQPVPPSDPNLPPPHRPDVPCETQEPPNLNAPGGVSSEFSDAGARPADTRAVQTRMRRFLSSDRFEKVREAGSARRAAREDGR